MGRKVKVALVLVLVFHALENGRLKRLQCCSSRRLFFGGKGGLNPRDFESSRRSTLGGRSIMYGLMRPFRASKHSSGYEEYKNHCLPRCWTALAGRAYENLRARHIAHRLGSTPTPLWAHRILIVFSSDQREALNISRYRQTGKQSVDRIQPCLPPSPTSLSSAQADLTAPFPPCSPADCHSRFPLRHLSGSRQQQLLRACLLAPALRPAKREPA